MRRKLILGLFCPVNMDLTPYINVLQGLGEVRLIVARQENLGPIDLLIYPNGMGIFPDTPGLCHGRRVYIYTESINPFFYLFWNEHPFQTLVEERGIPVLGIGEAAAMMYSEMGGKLCVRYDGAIELIETEIKGLNFVGDKNIVGFQCGNVYGCLGIENITQVLYQAIEQIFIDESIDDLENGDEEDDDAGPYIPKVPTPPPPNLTGKS